MTLVTAVGQFPVASGDGRLLFLIQLLCGWLTGVMLAVGFRKEKTRRRVLLEEKKITCMFIGPGCIEGYQLYNSYSSIFSLQLKC